MRNIKLDGEQVMRARQLKSEFNYAGAAFIVAAAAKDVLSMRILTDMQEQMDNNNGKLPVALQETLRIIVSSLHAKMESKATAQWILGCYLTSEYYK